MNNIELFDRVKCSCYIVKNKEYKELGVNENYCKDLYLMKNKEFTGIVAGIYRTYAKRVLSSNSINGKNYLCNKKIEPFKVAKVYFANNKSRLVPLKFIQKL